MPEYNINFKYQPGSTTSTGSRLGAIGGIRNKALQASQKMPDRLNESSRSNNRNNNRSIEASNRLTKSIDTLNQSITSLSAVMKNNSSEGSGRQGRNFGWGKSIVGGMAGGSVGGVIGFAMQKLSEVGNAYISKVSEQKGTAGIAGFQTGQQGMYLGTEAGAMRKEFLMASGRFKGKMDPFAAQFGTIFGLSPDEVGRTAGLFSRYGANYSNAAYQAAGAGIQTDMPRFLQGLASEMEEAVKKGVNASSLAGDMGEQLAGLVMSTPTKSVEMALGIVNKLKPVQDSAARGMISGMNELMTWRGGQQRMLSMLNSPVKGFNLIQSWKDQGLISDRQMEGLLNRRGILNLESVQKIVGAGGATALTRDVVSAMNPVEASRAMIRGFQNIYGKGPQGMNAAYSVYSQYGGNMLPREFTSLWQNEKNPLAKNEMAKGAKITSDMYSKAMESPALMGVGKEQMQLELLYSHGKAVADTLIEMEKPILRIAKEVAPGFEAALKGMTKAVKNISNFLNPDAATRKENIEKGREMERRLNQIYNIE